MGQEKALIDLPDGGVAAFLDGAMKLTTKDAAAFVRVVYPKSGRIVIAVMPAKKALPVVSLKFNPNHVQSGPEGGQFTGGEGLTGFHYDKANKRWLGPNGKPVSSAIAARLAAAKVKPGLVDVALNPDPNAALQATGKDSKGKTQYSYSKEHSETAAAEKFARLKDFHAVLPGLRAQLGADMVNKSLPGSQRDGAAVLSIIDHTAIRLGSDRETGGAVKAYGATTLLGEHITLGPKGRIELSFTGKHGVMNKAAFVDPALHAYIAAKGLKASDRAFDIKDSATRAQMQKTVGKDFSPKDFRTWTATAIASHEVSQRSIPKTKTEYDHQRLDVGRVVAAHLNNTPKMALDSYIDPAVFKRWGKP